MKKVLHIKSSINGERSYSVQLGNAIIQKIKQTLQDTVVTERDLSVGHLPHLNQDTFKTFHTPKDHLSGSDAALIKASDEVVQEVLDADIIVIGAPLYNFSIPSTLKSWIDHLSRAGVTFTYGANGPEGLIKDKKVIVAMSSGGVYSEGPAEKMDFVAPYLKTILGFLGMTDVEIVRAEGTGMPDLKDTAVEKAIENFDLRLIA